MQVIKISSSLDIGKRLDHYLTIKLKEYSRSQIQLWIRSGYVLVNKKICKTGYSLELNDHININLPEIEFDHGFIKPEPIKLNILHEDDEIIIINKPPGLVVHPGRGNQTGTLVHGLLHYFKNLSNINGFNRPGIVHRLDQDTSGLMVVAKTNYAHNFISSQFKNRKVKKEYLGLTWGTWKEKEGEINLPIKRNKKDPTKYKISPEGKRSLTAFKVEKEFQHFSLVRFFPKTGRTHQIRIHSMHFGHPIFGDEKYGGGFSKTKGFIKEYNNIYYKAMGVFNRHALHAERLEFCHPINNDSIIFKASLPKEFITLINLLESLYAY